ncbi:MAG: hypothetical protein RLY49_587, partial [Candidatus Parcubacteria bacterium]
LARHPRAGEDPGLELHDLVYV